MASKFVRSVKDIYNLENFNTNLLDENDICSTVDGDVYIYTKNGFLLLESIEPLQDEVQEVQEKLSDNEQRIYNNEEKIKVIETSVNNNEEKIKVIETSVEDNKLKVNEVNEKLDNIHLDELEKKIDSINIDELKQKIDSINIEDIKKEQETLSKKIDETTKETKNEINKKIDKTTKETNQKIQSNTDKINDLNITDTGWQNINITGSGLKPHTDPPQYRITTVKGIRTVALRGAVNGYTGKTVTIGKIPISSEFSNPHYYVQNTSKKGDSVYHTRITVKREGDILLEGTTYPNPDGSEWCPINTVFID